jgi:hypothetical protein
LEFIEATNAGLPRLVFLLDDTADVPAELVDTDRTAVDQFRQRLREAGLICTSFATADGLELAAFHALKELAGADARAVPRQLPAAVAHFAGRSGELATLSGLLRGRAEAGGTGGDLRGVGYGWGGQADAWTSTYPTVIDWNRHSVLPGCASAVLLEHGGGCQSPEKIGR